MTPHWLNWNLFEQTGFRALMVFRWAGGCLSDWADVCVPCWIKMQWNKTDWAIGKKLFFVKTQIMKNLLCCSGATDTLMTNKSSRKTQNILQKMKKIFFTLTNLGCYWDQQQKVAVLIMFFYIYFRMERDADFLHKKAERATLRVCLREKYRLPKVKSSVTSVLYINKLSTVGTQMHNGWLLIIFKVTLQVPLHL